MKNIEWLYENDEWFCAMVNCAAAALAKEGIVHADGRWHDWLLAEHVDDGTSNGTTDGTCPDDDGTASNKLDPNPRCGMRLSEDETREVVDKNYGQHAEQVEHPETHDYESYIRKKVNALRAYYGAGPTAMTDEQIAAGREVYGAKKDVDMVIVDELRIDEPDTIRNEQIDNGQLAPESDSREKLEAEIVSYFYGEGTDLEERVAGWLNRQAAITVLDDLHFMNRQQERIAALQAKVDELERENARLSSDEFYLRCTLVDMDGEVVG